MVWMKMGRRKWDLYVILMLFWLSMVWMERRMFGRWLVIFLVVFRKMGWMILGWKSCGIRWRFLGNFLVKNWISFGGSFCIIKRKFMSIMFCWRFWVGLKKFMRMLLVFWIWVILRVVFCIVGIWSWRRSCVVLIRVWIVCVGLVIRVIVLRLSLRSLGWLICGIWCSLLILWIRSWRCFGRSLSILKLKLRSIIIIRSSWRLCMRSWGM